MKDIFSLDEDGPHTSSICGESDSAQVGYDFDISSLSPGFTERGEGSGVDHHHLAGLIGLHDAVGLVISSKLKMREGFALRRRSATWCAISCSGTSDNGKPGVPNTKLPKKVR